MKFIKTKFFHSQILELSKKYKFLINDLSYFENNINSEPFSDLWNNIFKYRIRNSSIPTWKRWWFRIIIKKHWNNILPIIIYSKTNKENVNDKEIINALKIIFEEL